MLTLYNTLTRKKEAFTPAREKKVNLFLCGPTVYDHAHLGHAKTYVQFDVIVKYLRWKGYDVYYLQNITDIDDKIIQRAKEHKTDWKTVAKTYEQSYYADMQTLGVNAVTKYAPATEYIPQIVSQVQRLIQNGYAYKISDGYYYDISKFKDYGKLARRTVQEAEDGISRIDENTEKKNKGDFCLWKFKKEGEPSWDPKGLAPGRPGWHIEDTAITEHHFGSHYDVHGGGMDLIFPHHEAEIAQMEAISGQKPFVTYWMHVGFLNINKEKMSKSLGNFATIRDTLTAYSARVVRYYLLSAHYRKPVDFNPELLDQAKHTLQRIDDFLRTLRNYTTDGKETAAAKKILTTAHATFEKAMDDDFETSNALAALFNLIKKTNTLITAQKLTRTDAHTLLAFIHDIDTIFGVLEHEENIPKEIQALVDQREHARKNKQWKDADALRNQIQQNGYTIDDSPQGPIVKKL